jgi:hypothetical protein
MWRNHAARAALEPAWVSIHSQMLLPHTIPTHQQPAQPAPGARSAVTTDAKLCSDGVPPTRTEANSPSTAPPRNYMPTKGGTGVGLHELRCLGLRARMDMHACRGLYQSHHVTGVGMRRVSPPSHAPIKLWVPSCSSARGRTASARPRRGGDRQHPTSQAAQCVNKGWPWHGRSGALTGVPGIQRSTSGSSLNGRPEHDSASTAAELLLLLLALALLARTLLLSPSPPPCPAAPASAAAEGPNGSAGCPAVPATAVTAGPVAAAAASASLAASRRTPS